MNKLLFFFLLFYLHVANVYSDIIKPNTKIEPYNVVEIQLISLKRIMINQIKILVLNKRGNLLIQKTK